jgi:hypothetical protein
VTGRFAWVYSRRVGSDLECRSFFFEEGDFMARIAFTAPRRGLKAFEAVMSEMVAGFRFAGGNQND